MALSKQFWSINALSTELDVDRRSLAKRLYGLEPVKIEGKSRLYSLRAVLAYLDGSGARLSNDEEGPLIANAEDAAKTFACTFDTAILRLADLLKATSLSHDQCLDILRSFWFIYLLDVEEMLGPVPWENWKNIRLFAKKENLRRAKKYFLKQEDPDWAAYYASFDEETYREETARRNELIAQLEKEGL